MQITVTPLHWDPKQQEPRVRFKASFDQGPYGGFFCRTCEYNFGFYRPSNRTCEYNSGFMDLAAEHVNITFVL